MDNEMDDILQDGYDSTDLDCFGDADIDDRNSGQLLENEHELFSTKTEELDDDKKINFPHIKISKIDFLNILKVSSQFCNDERKYESGDIFMKVYGDCLKAYLTDHDIFITIDIELMNKDNILTDFLVIKKKVITFMLPACNSLFVIYKDGDKFFLQLRGGAIEIDAESRKEESYVKIAGIDKFPFLSDIDVEELNNIIYCMAEFANSASAVESKVCFDNNKAIVAYGHCAAKYVCKNTFPSFDLKIRDIKFLKTLLKGYTSKTLSVAQGGNRLIISGVGDNDKNLEKFTYSFTQDKSKPNKDLINKMDVLLIDENMFVLNAKCTKYFKSIVTLAKKLDVSFIQFNCASDGLIKCFINSKPHPYNPILESAPNANAKPFKTDIKIRTKLLYNLLTIFTKAKMLCIYLSNEGIVIKDDNCVGVVYTEV